MLKPYACLALFCSLLLPSFAHADDSDVGCVTTEWKLLGANHKVCVSAFNDPDIPGVACYISQAKTGGVSGSLGLAEDPSNFAISCSQVGPIEIPAKLPKQANVFREST
ncbi:MAG: CreA family protein, partial [Bilophila wadsworthia]